MKIAVFGAYTLHNIGDDLFYFIFGDVCSRLDQDICINYISYNTDFQYQKLGTRSNLSYIYTYSKSLHSVIGSIWTSKLLVIGPGSVFGDQKKFIKQNLYILFLCIVARLRGINIYFLGIDVPYNIGGGVLQLLIRIVLKLSTKIYVRFSENIAYILEVYKISPTKLHAMHDFAYTSRWLSLIPVVKLPKKDTKIGIVLSDLRHMPMYELTKEFILSSVHTLESSGYTLQFFSLNMGPHKGNKDQHYLEDLVMTEGLDPMYAQSILTYDSRDTDAIGDVMSHIQSCRSIISNKLHCSILASILDIPYISWNYHTKMHYLNQEIGFDKQYEFDVFEIHDLQSMKKRFLDICVELPKEANFDTDLIKHTLKTNQIILDSTLSHVVQSNTKKNT